MLDSLSKATYEVPVSSENPASTYLVLLLSAQSSLSEVLSELFWEWPQCRGIEEIPDSSGSNIYVPSEEFEVLEFGSEAAKRCADWLESGHFQSQRDRAYLKVYLEFPKDRFPLSAESFLSEVMEPYRGRYEILSWNELPDTNYLEEYKKNVKGSSVGKRFWVGPPWDKPPIGRHPFFVEPGMAFGTGDHPTTQMCLELLEELSLQNNFNPQQIVDIGTGSGILAAAARYFFPNAKILVTDLDPLCEQEVLKTFTLNKMTLEGVTQIYGPKADLRHNSILSSQSDLLLSNIYAEVLTPLVPQLSQLLKPQAPWIVSGLLEGPVTESFQVQALNFFHLQHSKSRTQEKPHLESKNGLSQITESWGARLFLRKD